MLRISALKTKLFCWKHKRFLDRGSVITFFCFIALCFAAAARAEAESSTPAWIEDALNLSSRLLPLAYESNDTKISMLEKEAANNRVEISLPTYQQLGFRYAVSLQWDKYIALLPKINEALALSPKTKSKHFQIILESLAMGLRDQQYEQALEKLNTLRKENELSTDISIHVQIALAYLYSDLRVFPAAFQATVQSRNLFYAGDFDEHILIELLFMEAYIFYNAEEYHKAIEAYLELEQIASAQLNAEDVLSELVWMLRESDQYAAANDINNQLIEKMPDDLGPVPSFFLHIACGDIEASLGNYDRALDCLSIAESFVEFIPDRWVFMSATRLTTLVYAGRLDEAKALFNETVNDERYTSNEYSKKAMAMAEIKYHRAIGDFEIALDQMIDLYLKNTTELLESQNDLTASLSEYIEKENKRYLNNLELKQALINKQTVFNILAVLTCFILFGMLILLIIRRRRERAIERTDSLTGLLNRKGFFTVLNDYISQNVLRTETLVLGLIDLDEFKSINDVFGHAIGDELLVQIVARIKQKLGMSVLIGRVAGDEFAICIKYPGSVEAIKDFGDSLCKEISKEHNFSNPVISVDASIGFAIYPEASNNIQSVYEYAEFALRTAKERDKGKACIFDSTRKAELERHKKIQSALIHAKPNEFTMLYQPIIDIRENRVKGFEALIRWHSPSLGAILPFEFIPMAERSGKVCELTNIALKQALKDAQQWPDDVHISINVSSHDLTSVKRAEEMKSIIIDSGIACERLVIEMTETAIVHDTKTTKEALGVLSSLGVRIALDDFGTGFSSLTHLLHFNIDRIKIDRILIKDIEKNLESRSIVQAILDLSDSVGADCVVEGLETQTQLKLLANKGKRALYQGYLFAKPLPIDKTLDHRETLLNY